jgi:hypothetical protein
VRAGVKFNNFWVFSVGLIHRIGLSGLRWEKSAVALNVSAGELNRTHQYNTVGTDDQSKTLTWSIWGDIIEGPAEPQRSGQCFTYQLPSVIGSGSSGGRFGSCGRISCVNHISLFLLREKTGEKMAERGLFMQTATRMIRYGQWDIAMITGECPVVRSNAKVCVT